MSLQPQICNRFNTIIYSILQIAGDTIQVFATRRKKMGALSNLIKTLIKIDLMDDNHSRSA